MLLLTIAGCGGRGASTAKAISSSLDNLLVGAGASSDELGRALTLGSDEVASLRTAPGATDELIRSTAAQLDSQTTLPSRVEQALGNAVGEAPPIVSAACDIYDGYVAQPTSVPDEVAAVLREFQEEETLADSIARTALCNGMKAVDAVPEI